MTYQDQKARAIARLTIIAVVVTGVLLAILIDPDHARPLLQHMPVSRHSDGLGSWVVTLAILAPILWAVDLAMILTSPEHEVRFVQWSKRWRKTQMKFEEIEFDTLDPDYRKPAWRYFLDRGTR